METTLQSNQSIAIHVNFLVNQSSILLTRNRNHLISIINPQSISYQNLNISIQFTIHSFHSILMPITIHSSKQQSIKIILQANQAITIHIHHNSSHQILFSLQKPPQVLTIHHKSYNIHNKILSITKLSKFPFSYSSLHHNIIIS